MELPKRKSIRLKDYDYSQNGMYFVTICTHNRENLFGKIHNGTINLSEYGEIILKHIQILSNLYDDIKVDKYIIMPNHIHMIIEICRERIICVPKIDDKTKMIIPKIIQIFKSSVTKEIRILGKRYAYNAYPTIWQRGYYEHIIRNEKSYNEISEYIDTNPIKWELDKYYK